jgi:hypothetical protein
MHRTALIAAALGMLAACSTTTTEKTALAVDRTNGVTVDSVTGDAAPGVPADIAGKLNQALHAELAKYPQGAVHLQVHFTVETFQVVGAGGRFMFGGLAGNNEMVVTVNVLNASGAPAGEFKVDRNTNPGGYGFLVNQEQNLLDSTAEAIVQKIER